MTTLLEQADAFNEYMETADARQLRVALADEIRRLNKELWDAKVALSNLKTAMLRANSQKMTRRF